MPPPAHADELAALATRLQTDLRQGLSEEAAARRAAEVGRNALVEPPPPPTWKKLVRQFDELVVWILLGAAAIAAATGEWTDAGAILAIVLMNGVLGFLQEERAGRALAALQRVSAPTARAVRGGHARSLPAEELVPGDRIELEAGDRVPADARLVEAFGLRLEEALLTGESVPADKEAGGPLPPETPLAGRSNLVHMGTLVAGGTASALVVATGMRTELGRLAALMQQHEPEPTPLQQKLAELGRVLLGACLVVAGLVFALELAREGQLAKALLLSVSLAVAAVPEGLTAVVTVALAIGLQRMSRRNALIRRLHSVETLGAVTVVCTDKTGTLTRNEMTARELWMGATRLAVSGAGWAPVGELTDPQGRRREGRTDPGLALALEIAARCNTARLEPEAGSGGWRVVGDPTEGALLTLARKGGVVPTDEPLLGQVPFDSRRKAMSVVVQGPDGPRMLTKGAPEAVLARCASWRDEGGQVAPLDEARRAAVLAEAAGMAGRALRVLALACRDAPERDAAGAWREEGLTLVGLVGMIDPPRDEARAAVATCRGAGIRPVMITGDHPATALAIARELGIAQGGDRVLSGPELDLLPDAELERSVDQVSVYARVSAEHKLRIVRAWKRRGEVVAMTGDGVNDAPAVRAADIGIAMGRTGTEVTKQASAMVLADDNFASIVAAVEEGRAIYDNIQKVVVHLLSCNTGEVLLVVVAALLGWPAPLLAVQLLWINLVTDGLPSLALVLEAPERDIMRRLPRPPRQGVLTGPRVAYLLAVGALIAGVAAAGFHLTWRQSQRLDHARTAAFCVMTFSQLFLAFASRSWRRTLPELGPLSNLWLLAAIAVSGLLQLGAVVFPFSQRVFGTAGHDVLEWLEVLGLALVPVTVVEVAKLLRAAVGRAPA